MLTYLTSISRVIICFMIKIGVNGACGRMGTRLIQLIRERSDLRLTLALESPKHPALGRDIGLIIGVNQPLGVCLTSYRDYYKPRHAVNYIKPEVILDFSTPSGTLTCVEFCARGRIALLVGTTGLTNLVLARIKQVSKMIPCLLSPNFSLGANILACYTRTLAHRFANQYDIEVIETHHRSKKDKPSGTALRLAQEIKANLKDKTQEIPIHSLRIGDVIGEHKLILGLKGETLELTHRVQSRDAFAQGALDAVRFLAQAKPGLYELDKVLGIT